MISLAAFWHWFSVFSWFFHLIFLEMVFPIHSLSVLGLVVCKVNENSLNCTSGLVLLCFISSWFLLRPYDVTATFCSFVHAISTELHAWRLFWLLLERVFFVHSRDKIFGHTWLTSLSEMTSSLWNWLLFALIQRDKVKWVCVTLNEGYLRSANRGSNNLYRLVIKMWQISLQW